MYQKKKERLYVSELLEEPVVAYPAYYVVSASMMKNEMFHHALMVLHAMDFEHYEHPKSHEDIFSMFESGLYPIYKELHVVGFFGGKMMYLESAGWKAMNCTQDVFKMENWLVC
ncbi:MAG TPA: hypothetical protein ENK82_02830 [Campylobacterales bacterium]|nr:hypothetical protein [Campylobacterales bacterium]HHS92255.1 hypothetical protein [Campylobacterales bacterium]